MYTAIIYDEILVLSESFIYMTRELEIDSSLTSFSKFIIFFLPPLPQHIPLHHNQVGFCFS